MAESSFRSDFLAGKVALVTGGGTGICFEIAKAFLEHGCKVALMGRRREVLEEARQSLGSFANRIAICAGDVRRPENCEEVLKEVKKSLGGLDILLNGAAGNFLCPPEHLSPNGFKTVVDIDLCGTFNMCRAAFEALKDRQGMVLNISATLHYQGTFDQLHVSCAKAGVDALTQNLACEWGHHGIRVCGIAPGPIADTEGMRRLGPEDAERKFSKVIALRRMGRKRDIANAALFLVSEAAAYITGEVLVVDGGAWLYKPPFMPREVVLQMLTKQKGT